MAEQRAEVDAITADPAAADVREHARRAGTVRGDPAPRLGGVLHPRRLLQHPGHPGHRGRGGAAARRARRRDHARRRAVRPHRRAVRPRGTSSSLDPESLRLLERRHRDAVRAGARLGRGRAGPAARAERRAVRADHGVRPPAAGRGERLGGARRPTPRSSTGWPRTRSRPRPGPRPPAGWTATCSPSCCPPEQPALASLTDRDLRERLHTRVGLPRARAATSTTPATWCCRIAALRAERARLLGHPHHASWVVEIGTAGSAEAVDAMLGKLAPLAAANARGGGRRAGRGRRPPDRGLGPRVPRRAGAPRARFDVDAAALRPYFELERVLHDGVFHAAGLLYGLRFAERHDLPALPPRRPRLRRVRRGRRRSGSSSPTSTPATPSAAAPG